MLVSMLRLVNNREVRGMYVNLTRMNVITWITVAALILSTFALP